MFYFWTLDEIWIVFVLSVNYVRRIYGLFLKRLLYLDYLLLSMGIKIRYAFLNRLLLDILCLFFAIFIIRLIGLYAFVIFENFRLYLLFLQFLFVYFSMQSNNFPIKPVPLHLLLFFCRLLWRLPELEAHFEECFDKLHFDSFLFDSFLFINNFCCFLLLILIINRDETLKEELIQSHRPGQQKAKLFKLRELPIFFMK